MALMRKSRRERSSSMVSANTTVSGMPRVAVYSVDAVGCYLEGNGFNQDGHRSVLRSVSTTLWPAFLKRELVSCQGAEVAMSQSLALIPMNASRTHPPTSQALWPASFKLVQDVERPCIDRYVGGKIHGRNGSGKRGEKQQGIADG